MEMSGATPASVGNGDESGYLLKPPLRNEGGDPPHTRTAVSELLRRSLGFGQGTGLGSGGRLGLVVALEPFDLLDELADVLELTVDRGEAYVGDWVEPLQMVHDHTTQLLAADLLLGTLVQLRFDID